MLQVQRETWGVPHRNKNKHGKNKQCDFWKRQLVTSIPANPTWKPGPPFLRRPVSAMFPIVILRLPEPCQQVASLSHIASWGSNQHNWRLVRTSWFIPTTKGNTIRLGWPRLQIHSLSCSTPQALGTTVGYSLHRKATLLPGQKPSQLLASETCWALMSSELQLPSEPVRQYFRKHGMPLW